MGDELLCTVRIEDKVARGKALLETSAIVFRGELRLKIPLAELTSVSARNGQLHLKWPEGSAIFDLGPQADRWAHKILHPKSLAEKLGVKRGMTISTISISDREFVSQLREQAGKFSQAKPLQNSDLIFYGVDDTAGLDRTAKLADSLASTGALWIVYPKGRKDIKEQQVLDAGKRAALVDVKVVSFSATHTALKFVIPKARR